MSDEMKALDGMPYDQYLKQEAEKARNAARSGTGAADGPEGEDGVDQVPGVTSGDSGPESADRLSKGSDRMSTSEFGAAAKADDDRSEEPDGKDGSETVSYSAETVMDKMKNLLLKGKTGAGKMLTSVMGSMSGMAQTLNMSMRLFTIVSIILGGSAVSIFGALLFGNGNVGRYLPAADCRVDKIEYTPKYTDNETMPSWDQGGMDSAAHSIYQALSSKEYIDGIIEKGDETLDSEVTAEEIAALGVNYNYVIPKNLRDQRNVDSSKAATSGSLTGWTIFTPGRGSSNAGESETYGDIGFTDEAILAMISNAQAESAIRSNIWEGYNACWFYYPDGETEIPVGLSSGGSSKGGRNIAMATSHHRDWNNYVLALAEWWKQDCDVEINLEAYKYTDKNNSGTAPNGTTNYYPGIGLWQWTGPRAYALQEWANRLENVSDNDLDDANDAMYGLSEQIYYAVFENHQGFSGAGILEADGSSSRSMVNGDGVSPGSLSLIDWGCMARAKYDETCWVNIPNKPDIGSTEKMNGRTRAAVPVSNDSVTYERHYRTDDEVIMPVVDYVYDINGRRAVNQTVLNEIWGEFVTVDNAHDHTCSENCHTNDDKIAIMMQDHVDPVTGEKFWKALDELDLLDVGKTDGTYTWGENLDYDIGSSCRSRNMSIYDTRVYYDLSVEVTARYADGSVIIGADGGGVLSRDASRPDYAVYGRTPGNGIIYESTFENMTGSIAYNSNGAGAGSGNHSLVFGEELFNHDWVATSDYNILSKMGRGDQWGDYGSDTVHGAMSASEFTGWTDASFQDWWNNYHDRHEERGTEYGDAYYREKLAATVVGTGTSGYASRCIVTELNEDSDAEYEFCRKKSDALAHWSEARALAQVARISAREFTQFWEGSGAIGHLNSHSQYGSLVHYATMIIDNTWERNENSASSMLKLWNENTKGGSLHEWWKSFYHNYCGDSNDIGFGGIAEMAVNMSWLNGHWDDTKGIHNPGLRWQGGGKYSMTYCTPLYCAIKCIVGVDDGSSGTWDEFESASNRILYSSCDRGVCTSVRSAGADDNFPWGACVEQVRYVKSHPEKWECLGLANGLWDSMEPGDLLLSDHHVIVFVGPEYVVKKWPDVSEADAKYAICHSSYSNNIDNSRGLRCDLNWQNGINSSGDFYVYRLVGEPDEQSVYKTRVEAEADNLAGLWDGSF